MAFYPDFILKFYPNFNLDIIWIYLKVTKVSELISKYLFGVFSFLERTKTSQPEVSLSKFEFIHSFFGRNDGLKNHFNFVLPLVGKNTLSKSFFSKNNYIQILSG